MRELGVGAHGANAQRASLQTLDPGKPQAGEVEHPPRVAHPAVEVGDEPGAAAEDRGALGILGERCERALQVIGSEILERGRDHRVIAARTLGALAGSASSRAGVIASLTAARSAACAPA